MQGLSCREAKGDTEETQHLSSLALRVLANGYSVDCRGRTLQRAETCPRVHNQGFHEKCLTWTQRCLPTSVPKMGRLLWSPPCPKPLHGVHRKHIPYFSVNRSVDQGQLPLGITQVPGIIQDSGFECNRGLMTIELHHKIWVSFGLPWEERKVGKPMNVQRKQKR